MLIVRCVREDDLDSLFDLIQKSEFGLTTLKISKSELESRIERSLFAFRQKDARPSGQPYVFVMEDLGIGRLVGTCAIYSKTGGFEPMYSYEIQKSIHASKELGVYKEIDTLHLLAQHDGPTEIGSLFLSPDYWGGGHGRLLSMSRFLFLAEFQERFEQKVIAEMRGVVDSHGVSPLWSALGSHFFQMDFPKAETLTTQSKKVIGDLMPKHPIYIPLLPQDAQDVIGKVHANTEPALAMLLKEGFENRGLVDLFDGGPTIECEVENIRAVRESKSGTVGAVAEKIKNGTRQIISNSRLDFRTCLGEVQWDGAVATIDQISALRLGLKNGDAIRSVNLRPDPAPNTESDS
ncbi:arginine N-succinyltransferase [Mariniblastus fucicola]|uniref:Arginine N-succinyltransferase n=1 Tax=Mariniblastus fucicola TaxID=980251 RepID=A0A5B9P969_9BACT|nr:arginine N-succinyltransferase [Mariniblastus fucicola]QEG21186.1 Arginine N-succinyltransferase [Mariniblastus fucicola]